MKSKAALPVPQQSEPHRFCGFQNYSQLGAATSKICSWLWHNERDNKYIKLGISRWKMKEILWTQAVNSAENPPVCSAWLMPWPLPCENLRFNFLILISCSGGSYGRDHCRDSGLIHCWENVWLRGPGGRHWKVKAVVCQHVPKKRYHVSLQNGTYYCN